MTQCSNVTFLTKAFTKTAVLWRGPTNESPNPPPLTRSPIHFAIRVEIWVEVAPNGAHKHTAYEAVAKQQPSTSQAASVAASFDRRRKKNAKSRALSVWLDLPRATLPHRYIRFVSRKKECFVYTFLNATANLVIRIIVKLPFDIRFGLRGFV